MFIYVFIYNFFMQELHRKIGDLEVRLLNTDFVLGYGSDTSILAVGPIDSNSAKPYFEVKFSTSTGELQENSTAYRKSNNRTFMLFNQPESVLGVYASELKQSLPSNLQRKLGLKKNENKISNYFSDEFVNYLTNEITFDLNSISSSNKPSFNQVFFAKDVFGKEYVLRVTSNKQKAETELDTLNSFSLDNNLSKYFTTANVSEPIELQDGLYLTIQERIINESPVLLEQYINALSSLHMFGESALDAAGKKLTRTWTPEPFDNLKDSLKPLFDVKTMSNLSSIYSDAENVYTTILGEELKVVTHTDTKQDNLCGGKLIDTESIQFAHPSVGLSLLLATSAGAVSDWSLRINQYVDNLPPGELNNLFSDHVYLSAILTISKELAGIQSRKQTSQTDLQKVNLVNVAKDLTQRYIC